MGHGLIGIGNERLLQMQAGFSETVHAHQGDAVAELVEGVISGAGEVPDGLLQITLIGAEIGHLRMGGGEGGTEAEGGAEFSLCFGDLAGLG